MLTDVVQDNIQTLQVLMNSPNKNLRNVAETLYFRRFSSTEEAVELILDELVQQNDLIQAAVDRGVDCLLDGGSNQNTPCQMQLQLPE